MMWAPCPAGGAVRAVPRAPKGASMASKKTPAVATPAPAKKAGGILVGVSEKQLTQFTTQLSTLQDAGLPIVSCLKILEGQLRKGYFKNVLIGVTEDVESGSSLSEALAKHPKVFDH